MKLKKALAVLLAVMCVLSMVGVVVAADVNATVGKTVEFVIAVEEAISVAGIELQIEYDTSVFSTLEIVAGESLKQGSFMGSEADNGCLLLWYNMSGDVSVSGTLATITLLVDANATAGDYPVSISGEIIDFNNADVEAKLVYPSNIIVAERDPVDITISDASVLTGDTMKVPVSIAKNEGFASFAFQVKEIKGMNLVAVHEGELLKGAGGSMTFNPATGIVLWTASSENAVDVVGDGEFLVLEYAVPEDFEAGTYSLSMALKDGLGANFVDINEVKIPANFFAGQITVIDYIPGDVNDDGVVSVLDAVKMARCVVGYETLEGKAFKSADLDKDGYVTAKDCLRMSKFFAGLVETL